MSLSQKVAFNTAVQIFSKAATVVFGLLTAIVLTGYLGREAFGDFTYVITLVVIFGAFADWGTQIIGVREAAQERKKQGQYLGNIFLLRLGLAFLAALFLFMGAFILPLKTSHPDLLRRGIALGSFVIILFATKASFGIVFQTRLEMQRLAVADIIGSALVFLFSWLFVRQQGALLFFILAVILGNLVAVSVAWFLARKTIKLSFSLNENFLRRMTKEALPMGLILLVFTLDNKIDTVMLGSIKGSAAVGVYGVAYRIYDVLILGAAYLMNALLPVLSLYNRPLLAEKGLKVESGSNNLQQIYQKAFDLIVLMGGGVMFFALIFSPLMVRVITQQRFSEFSDSALVLRVLSLALFLAYFNHLVGYTLVALGFQRRYLKVALTALVFNVALNLLVIPRFSYFGAAVVTILTEGLVLVITSTFIYRSIKISLSFTQFPKTAVELVKKKGKIF